MNGIVGADILLVEDDARDVELTLRALRGAGLAHTIHVAGDGAAALDYVNALLEQPSGVLPRVVFLDLKLPKISGLDVLRRLKADGRTRRVPVAIVSSSREESDVARAYELGANSYIVKPVNFESFAEAISRAGLYWLFVNETVRRQAGTA